jgi:membrane protein YdbS with pleckstrin-like domain
VRRLHPLGVTVATALAMLAFTMADLPIWWALAVLVTWLLWAACETVIWICELRIERRRYELRQLIARELATVPATTTVPTEFPKAWRPFIGERRPLSVSRHAAR